MYRKLIALLWPITLASELIAGQNASNTLTSSTIPSTTTEPVYDCPAAEEISPCVCHLLGKNQMEMDCSYVQNGDELGRVFSTEFELSDFVRLIIAGNYNLTTLREGDLGVSSFKEIYIMNGNLVEIEDLALVGSTDTLEYLDLYNNHLQTMPAISTFSRLSGVNLCGNYITEFPALNSMTLKNLDFIENPLVSLPSDAFQGLPAVEYVFLDRCNLEEIASGTFANNQKLSYLSLDGNNLKSLPLDAIQLSGMTSYLFLQNNQLGQLASGSISGVTGSIYMNGNSLTELNEHVFRPMLENNADVYLADNPFGCGCDIAWLILNQTLLDGLADSPSCQDGTFFVDLDPAYYEAMC
ncbi:oplophorus-luciferin 2-monooxygenase non-catalytic subunit-like [Palaemon carinicauda]|uniref:oplophorus-luciferin 2-monooxygenase non-catalytic subunit-like n=1 Tax=Palaemon carinicauda TaxID=392227 RepID=UPI0035B5B1E0